MVIVSVIFLGSGVKVRQYKCVGVQLLKSTIQFLCVSILETLLHLTLNRRAEMSADIFARLLRNFSLSCKNLTISSHILTDFSFRRLIIYRAPSLNK